MWPMGLLFLKTSSVKQYSYENDFSGVSDALHQSFLVHFVAVCPFDKSKVVFMFNNHQVTLKFT